jgi:hypothetical protein
MTQAAFQTESSISSSTDEIEIVIVPPGCRGEHIDKKIREHLEPSVARSRGRITMDNVFDMHDAARVQIFIGIENSKIICTTVTEVIEWSSGRRCMKMLLGGCQNGVMWESVPTMMEFVEKTAREIGCKSLLVDGRKGWKRVLPDGYEFSHATFEKEL